MQEYGIGCLKCYIPNDSGKLIGAVVFFVGGPTILGYMLGYRAGRNKVSIKPDNTV